MRGVAVLLAGIAALSVGGAPLAASSPSVTAHLSNSRAGARPVSLTLTFETVFACGQPRSASVVLPKGLAMPSRFAPGSVTVNGHVTSGVKTTGRTVTVSVPSGGKMTCHSLRLGTEVLTFTAKANLANPSTPGRYTIGITHGTTHASAAVTITR